ncbi:NAD-dependent epimerase/dehydratase family protein [Saccharomonospora iraqiensis]|uniref:NAD-dependent epimerase/dehydratase family protein n=1 Tax=Saccharomonospora iraqiensis TaxID=52698 RepID=UPI00022E0E60|nr:NAD(P)-dependent oxidoreductase [Saccharomonospora iraqiensis]
MTTDRTTTDDRTTTAGPHGRPDRIALTGAAGSLATDVLPGLTDLGHHVVGVDRKPATDTAAAVCQDWAHCEITDIDALVTAFTGSDAVVHLAGIPLEADWETVSRVNIDGTQAVLEAARRAGVPRVVLASSIHAVGYVAIPADGGTVPDDVPARPNTFYGVSKAAVEALGSLYHDRYGLEVVCLRIASRFARPRDERMLATWLSPADAVRLTDAALRAPGIGFRVVWGVSANSRGYLSHSGGAAIGYTPVDDAERYADTLFAEAGDDPSVLASEEDRRFLGGVFCSERPPMFEW